MSFQGIAPIRFGSVSAVTATRGPNDPEVGTRTTEDGRSYVYVYNAGNSTAQVGMGMVLATTATNHSCTITSVTSADLCIGVVKHANITTGAYGWLLTRGMGNVQMLASSGSVSDRGLLELGAAGLFAPVSNTTGNKAYAVGQALADIATGASGNAYIAIF